MQASKSVKKRSSGDAELARDGLHRHVRVEEARDLSLGVVMHEAQEIAHVHVVETDADDAELGHESLPSKINVVR
jgi:hypothetical protein